jgi:hypothetical protein
MRKLLTWIRRLALLATLVALAQQVLRRITRSETAGAGVLPPIVGDTWPPVPTNPERGD